jgi:hypothetical protein
MNPTIKMMRKETFAGLLIILLSAGGCKKPDTEKPVINTFLINQEQHEVKVPASSTIVLEATFTDNDNLKTYKVDIHDGFDGHGHGKTNNYQRFSYQNAFPIEGTNAEETQEIDLPQNAAAGPYHCILRVLDDAGNEGQFAEIDLLVTNNGQAAVQITSPDFSGEVQVAKGSQLTLQGAITDDIDIEEIYVTLGPEAEDHGKRSQASLLYEGLFELPGPADESWDFAELNNNKPIDIPAGAEAGHYQLKIAVTDSDGNMTIWEGGVEVD